MISAAALRRAWTAPGWAWTPPVIAALTQTVEIRPLTPHGTEVAMTFAIDPG